MTNANVLIVFFGLLGLVGLLFPKAIHTLYVEFMKFNLRSQNELSNANVSLLSTTFIRLLGIAMLCISALMYFLK